MKTNFKQWLLGVACALAACLPLASQAEPYFTNKEGNLILDKATNLVWQRCRVGQTWDGASCAGDLKYFTFDQAQNLTRDGWRVPASNELASLRNCSSGQFVRGQCSGRYSRPTIDTTAFPEKSTIHGYEKYWSSSPYADGRGSSAWYFNPENGEVYMNFKYVPYSVRLVRANLSSSSEAEVDFASSVDEIKRISEEKRQQEQRIAEAARQEEQRIAEAKRQEEERIAETKRQAEERRAKAQRTAAERSLIAGGAQDLYLKAGKAQRGGSLTVGGVSFYASELYEMVVEKFPKSEYAVKASDQLNAMDRAERQSSAVREAASRSAQAQREADQNASNRAACFSQVNSCTASCRSWGGSSVNYCIERCQRNCN